jgi:hypothetical protein
MADWITLGSMLAQDSPTRVPWGQDDMVKVIAIGGGLFVGMIAIVGAFAYSAYKTREIERTKRELAAYVAEGSMTVEQVSVILSHGLDEDERPDLGSIRAGAAGSPAVGVARA